MSHGVQGQLSSAKAELDLEIHKKIMRLASEKRQAQMEELSMDALIMAGTSSEEVLSLVTSHSKYIRAVTFENFCQVCVCDLLLQDLLQSCSRGGRRRVEDMCYERRRAEACVDESAHHALVNAGGREIV